jgi:hypothetical protein
LNKCSGALFETALQQAIQLEKEQSVGIGPYQKFIQKYHPKAFDIKYVVFQTQFQTEYGQEVNICGSIPELGNWKGNKALPMQWNPNNIWRTKPLSMEDLGQADYFEYKLLIFESPNKVV